MPEIVAKMQDLKSLILGATSVNSEFVDMTKSFRAAVEAFERTQMTNQILKNIEH